MANKEFTTMRGAKVMLEVVEEPPPLPIPEEFNQDVRDGQSSALGDGLAGAALLLWVDGKVILCLSIPEASALGRELGTAHGHQLQTIAQANAALKIGAELEAKSVNEETKALTLTEVLRWANDMPEHFKASRIGEVYRREVEKTIRKNWEMKPSTSKGDITLPGWSCPRCGTFNGAMKETRDTCRACELRKGDASYEW